MSHGIILSMFKFLFLDREKVRSSLCCNGLVTIEEMREGCAVQEASSPIELRSIY